MVVLQISRALNLASLIFGKMLFGKKSKKSKVKPVEVFFSKLTNIEAENTSKSHNFSSLLVIKKWKDLLIVKKFQMYQEVIAITLEQFFGPPT